MLCCTAHGLKLCFFAFPVWVTSLTNAFPWKIEKPGAVCIRSGYQVFVEKTVLRDYLDQFGPECPNGGWSLYAWKLLLHLIGGEERAFEIKSAFKDADCKEGMETILKESTL